MKNIATIADAWAELETSLNPKIPEHEKKAVERVFYAGATAMMLLVETVGAVTDDVYVGIEMMQAWQRELEEFKTNMVKENQAAHGMKEH